MAATSTNPPAKEREEVGREAQELQSPPPPGLSVPVYRGIVSEIQRGEPCLRDVGRGEESQEAQYVGEAEKRNLALGRGPSWSRAWAGI